MSTLTDGRNDLLLALGVFAEPPGAGHPRLATLLDLPAPAGSEWTEAFMLQLVPHASIYLSPDGMLGGEPADRVAGFWRALGLAVPADPDHLTALLGLYAGLLKAAARQPAGPRRVLLDHARTALLYEHLLSWLPGYTRAMVEVVPTPYAGWAALLGEALRREAEQAGPPDQLPAQLRAAPPPATAQDSSAAVVGSLLSPARSGLVLTRGHLGQLARAAGLGLRLGDRRQMLRALLDQEPDTVLELLAELAAGQAAGHREDEPLTGPIAAHWADRADATASLLRAGVAGRQEERT